MRPALILVLIGSLGTFPGQTDLWKKVGHYDPMQHLKIYDPGPAQLARVKKALVARVGLDNWPCAEEEDTEWTENLKFEELPVSVTQKIVLVEAGPGCARGGQGSDGAMWIIRFQGEKFSFLATPQQQFNGWLYSIQRTISHGFRDLVLGWHMGGGETGLSYFRFDGTCYQRIGAATQLTDEDDVEMKGIGVKRPPATAGLLFAKQRVGHPEPFSSLRVCHRPRRISLNFVSKFAS